MLLNDKTSDQYRPTHRVSVAPPRNLCHTVRDVQLKERDEENVKSRSPGCPFFLCSFSADLDSLLLALLLLSLSFSLERAERRGFELGNNFYYIDLRMSVSTASPVWANLSETLREHRHTYNHDYNLYDLFIFKDLM